MDPPIAFTKVKPMPPPITTVPTFSIMLLITPIFELTLAPPIIATVVFLSLPRALEILATSLFISAPKPLFDSSKNSAMIAVEACALCAVPKASFKYMSPSFDSEAAKDSSPAVSSL